MNIVLHCADSIGFASLVGLVVYSIQNPSGHTGFNPFFFLVVFIPLIGAGLFSFFSQRLDNRFALFTLGVGLLGVLFLVYLDETNTLLPYEIWVDRGMPLKGMHH